MRCIVLAGGSGDSLWPLSRKNYPKQFMNIKEGRSMLQETIVRNMPFCDEFIIVTKDSYKNIVNGQMKVFQSLKYRIILESSPRGTAAAIMLANLFCNQSELVFVVTADHIIDGSGYKDAVIRAKELAKEGNIVAIGIPNNESIRESYDCLICEGEDIRGFAKRGLRQMSESVPEGGTAYINSGLYIYRVGDLINRCKRYSSELYNQCRIAKRKVPALRRAVRFTENASKDIPAGSFETEIFRYMEGLKAVRADFSWKDIGTVDDIDELANISHKELVIKNQCENTTVINTADRHLVIANDLKDIVVVNTEDAIYVSSKDNTKEIKDIIKNTPERYESYFDFNRISYRAWGIHELLNFSDNYSVKKITIFPGMSIRYNCNENRNNQWSIVEGTATVTINQDTRDYNRFENVLIPSGVKYSIANRTDSNVVIIEVSIGEDVSDNEADRIYNSDETEFNYVVESVNPVVKLEPAFKDNLWGGTKLRTVFGKTCDYDIIAESWELSAHPDGLSRIASGRYKGMMFNDYLSIIGKDSLGWKCQAQDRFPILVKFIDAKEALSIQIHPDDEYALEKENEYGKNEMWYVVDAEPGSYLYCGLKKAVSKAELQERINNNTVVDVLNRVEVKKGDVVMVKAGTIHAIGAGIIICEIQQNSNCTYRMYDYDRRDKYGNTRELHIDKAMDVVDLNAYEKDKTSDVVIEHNEHVTITRLVQCKYFECVKYEITDETRLMLDESSFLSVVFIDGEGCISSEEYAEEIAYRPGDSFFISAGKHVINIKGRATCIITHI